MAKHKLDIDYDYDFILIGIACHEPNLKFVWQVNSKLQMQFTKIVDKNGKEADILIREKKNAEPVSFGIYHYHDEEIYTDFHIIVNKNENGTLVSEQKQADYFLKIAGNVSDEEKFVIMKKLKEISNVIMVFDIKPDKLKDKQYLIF